MSLDISNPFCIGENRLGYRFMIEQFQDGSWIGYADSDVGEFIFPDISRGGRLGVESREQAVGLTIAIAQDDERGYGGIDTWFIPPEARVPNTLHQDDDEETE
jgi:hypothetical protein